MMHLVLKISLATLGLILCIWQTSPCQDHALRQFSVDEGLPSSEVYSIFQTKEGYLIFTTDRGISKYDGYKFHNYSLQDGLPGNTVFGGFKEADGTIHFYTYDGDIFTHTDDSVVVTGIGDLKKTLNFRRVIQGISVDENRNTWITLSGYETGFVVLDSSNHIRENVNPIPTSCIQMKYADNGRYICAYNKNGNRVVLNLTGNRILDITDIVRKEKIKALAIMSATENDGLLYMVFRFGLLQIDITTKAYHYFPYKEGLSQQVFIDSKNNLWLGRAQRGILKFKNADLTHTPDTLLYDSDQFF